MPEEHHPSRVAKSGPREPAQTQVREGVENQGKVSFEGKTHLPSIFYLGSLVLYVVLGQLSTWGSCLPGQLSYGAVVVPGQLSYLGSCLPGQFSPG